MSDRYLKGLYGDGRPAINYLVNSVYPSSIKYRPETFAERLPDEPGLGMVRVQLRARLPVLPGPAVLEVAQVVREPVDEPETREKPACSVCMSRKARVKLVVSFFDSMQVANGLKTRFPKILPLITNIINAKVCHLSTLKRLNGLK